MKLSSFRLIFLFVITTSFSYRALGQNPFLLVLQINLGIQTALDNGLEAWLQRMGPLVDRSSMSNHDVLVVSGVLKEFLYRNYAPWMGRFEKHQDACSKEDVQKIELFFKNDLFHMTALLNSVFQKEDDPATSKKLSWSIHHIYVSIADKLKQESVLDELNFCVDNNQLGDAVKIILSTIDKNQSDLLKNPDFKKSVETITEVFLTHIDVSEKDKLEGILSRLNQIQCNQVSSQTKTTEL